MNFKKAIATGTAMAFLFSPVLNVSAAPTIPDGYVNTLKESGAESLILNVEAYKAAYSDLAEAFGDNTDAYIEHYLTTGIYEGRTIGALFNPLAYAEAYGDVKEAFGDDIAAIVNHYVTLGVAENRTLGTAGEYADLAVAESAEMPAALQAEEPDTFVPVAVNTTEADRDDRGTAEAADYSSNSGADNSSTAGGTNSAGNAGGTGAANNTAPSSGNTNSNRYHHTTSIYANDESTLLRVEYYDSNNKLFEFSQVTNHDTDTNSYTEDVYSYDQESDTIIHERTDTYVNGSLSSSEEHR